MSPDPSIDRQHSVRPKFKCAISVTKYSTLKDCLIERLTKSNTADRSQMSPEQLYKPQYERALIYNVSSGNFVELNDQPNVGYTGGLFHCYMLDESIFHFRGYFVGFILFLKEIYYFQTMQTLIRRHMMMRLIWVCIVCL